jgi:3-hydroxybutyryl-CoA dehydratase
MQRISFAAVRLGYRFCSLWRSITEADIVNFAGVSGDFNPLHTDEEWVREHTPFAGRIAHGLLVTAVASGLHSEYAYDWDIVAYLECTRRFRAPVYPGDSIQARYEVVAKRSSASRPGTGVVSLAVEIVNRHGEPVQTGQDVVLMADGDRVPGEHAP